MNVKILENKEDMIKIELNDLTFVNLLNDYVWKKRVQYAGYSVDHPYLSKPILIVKGKSPKALVINAAKQIAEDASALKKNAQRALKA